jgi:crossover junction endodeoxyribonuclease RuvC
MLHKFTFYIKSETNSSYAIIVEMRIIGVDPGIARCGFAVLDYKASKFNVLIYGCIETSSKKEVPKRLSEIYKEISSLIKTYSPDVLSIEELFFNTNAKTAFVVGQARGVIILAASENEIPVSIYTPLQVKMSLTGYGRAEKNQMGKMVKILLNLKEIPKLDDTTDALAVAITHAFSNKFNKSTL